MKKFYQTLHRTIIIGVSAMCLYLPPAISQASYVESNFDTDSEGWYVADWNNPDLTSVVATYSVNWNAVGGNPGGHITAADPGPNWFWLAAPSKFLGDNSSSYGTSLQYDFFVQNAAAGTRTLIILTGAGQRLYYDGDSPSTTSFTHYTIPLTQTGWRLNDYVNGVEPSEADMKTVLGNLDGLYINGDWTNGGELANLDNVQLNAVPIPPAVWLFGSGLLGLIGISRRKKAA